MNYNTDKPINNQEQDLLGRSFFSSQLGKAIYEYNAKDGLVIGLFGKWGTGKTSIINMAINEINSLANCDKKEKSNENKPLIIKFSPWNYSDKDNLITLFFQSLKNKINYSDNTQLKNKIGKALNNYSEAIEALSLIPTIGSKFSKILKILTKVTANNLIKVPDLDDTKAQLENALVKADKKIIVIIDDIDRLTNTQIRDIFQLVKQIADFPNIIYVLVMDRDIVSNALTDIHNINGSLYLEKIIQVPFELPELRESNLHNILFSYLDRIIENLPYKITLDKEYWSIIFENCVSPYIKTLRDINRLINTFQFKYEALYQETSFEDMLGITTLEVLEPKLYKWIANNKDTLCKGFVNEPSPNQNPRKLYHDEFVNMGIDPILSINYLSSMFPVFKKNINNYQYSFQKSSDTRGKMRISHSEKFELYFMFNLNDIPVSRKIITDCIHQLNKGEIIEVIDNINEQGNIIYLLEEMLSLVDTIPYARLKLIASAILKLQSKFVGKKSRYIFQISAHSQSYLLVEDIFKRFKTEEEKYDVICEAIKNIDKNDLGTTAAIITRIERAYGKLTGDAEIKDKQIISLTNLEKLEKLYVKTIYTISNSESILDIPEFRSAFYLWNYLDKDEAAAYLTELFKCEINKLKFVCTLASEWTSTNGHGWTFSLDYYSEYISQDEVYNTIQNLDKNKLNRFTEIELVKLASFTLNYHRDELDHVDEKKAKELVNEWLIGDTK